GIKKRRDFHTVIRSVNLTDDDESPSCGADPSVYYLLRYIDFFAYISLKNGSSRSLMKRMASPVDFISGPSCLSTSGNLSKEKIGSLMAYPFSLRSMVKSASLLAPSMTLVAILM